MEGAYLSSHTVGMELRYGKMNVQYLTMGRSLATKQVWLCKRVKKRDQECDILKANEAEGTCQMQDVHA